MKFLVTGGAGFIGSHLTEYLVNQGHSVLVVDNLCNGILENINQEESKIEFFKLNILDQDKLKEIAKGTDGIFHEASLTSVQESLTNKSEYYEVNVVGTENIFMIAKELGIKVVFASSAAVYGNVNKIPIKENFERKPQNPYGETKLKAELLAEKYSQLGTQIVGLRYFNVYGPRQNSAYAGVITKFLENVSRHKPPLIHGDGLQVRDFVYVEDVVTANLLAMKSEIKQGFINIGSGVTTSIFDLAEMIIRTSGLSLTSVYDKPLVGDVRASQADISFAKLLLDWKPETKLEDWITKFAHSMNK